MEQYNLWYSDSRKTSENKDFLKSLNKSLTDKKIDTPEAKELVSKFNSIREKVDWDINYEKNKF